MELKETGISREKFVCMLHLPSIACKLSLNCVCAHLESASWVRVAENKHLASRSLFVNSTFDEFDLVDKGAAADFNSVHGVLDQWKLLLVFCKFKLVFHMYEDLLPLVAAGCLVFDEAGWLSPQRIDEEGCGDDVECWKTPPHAGVEWADDAWCVCACTCTCDCCADAFASC